jgi:hypothetical protein
VHGREGEGDSFTAPDLPNVRAWCVSVTRLNELESCRTCIEPLQPLGAVAVESSPPLSRIEWYDLAGRALGERATPDPRWPSGIYLRLQLSEQGLRLGSRAVVLVR